MVRVFLPGQWERLGASDALAESWSLAHWAGKRGTEIIEEGGGRNRRNKSLACVS